MTAVRTSPSYPQPGEYGEQTAIEQLRAVMAHGAWFDRKRQLMRTSIEGVNFICTATPPQYGARSIDWRFVRRSQICCLLPPSERSLLKLTGKAVEHMLTARQYSKEVKSLHTAIATASIRLYTAIQRRFLPSPATPQYSFNLRHLWRMLSGIVQIEPAQVSGPICIISYRERLTIPCN